VVNSDVEPESEWLARLVGAMAAPDVWFATGKILNASRRDRIDGTYDLISRSGCAWRVGEGRLDGAEYAKTRAIAMASGAAALFRAELFRRVGRFDPAFESYLEDVDFGLRCALQNLQGVYVADAVAYHWGSASLGAWSPRMVRLVARNQVFLISKYYSADCWWPILVGQGLWGLLALRHGAGWAFLGGKVEGIRRRKSIAQIENHGGLARILAAGEREIRRRSHDLYWRVYFLLTAGGAD